MKRNLKIKGNLKVKGNYIKRWMACVLSLYMAFSPMSPVATVHAAPKDSGAGVYKDSDTELQDEALGRRGRSESTAFQWLKTKGSNEPGKETWRFDFCGLQNGMTEFGRGGIQTTWDWRGFSTWLGKANDKGNPPNVTGDVPGSLHKYNGDHNGAVESTDMGVELRITLSPSPDNKYIFVDYDVYNGNTKPGTYYLGTGADSMINQDDSATCYQNIRGFHMVSTPAGRLKAAGANRVFDCVTNDPALGITVKPDFRFVGYYAGYPGNLFKRADVDNNKASEVDSGIAWGWKLNLRPREFAHRRVAFAIRSTSFYVSADGEDSGEGTYSSPYKTVQHAIDKIGNNKGYVYLMDKNTHLTSPIEINKGSKTDITIASTDYNKEGNPVVGEGDYIKTLTSDGTAFHVSGGAQLSFTDITLDGRNTAKSVPMLSASGGLLKINSGTTIQGCDGTNASVGSAVDVTGGGTSLTLNRCTIKGNTSPQGGKGAVHFAGGGAFQVDGTVVVEDNTMPGGSTVSGGQSNVYLEKDKTITVRGSMGSGDTGTKIGVTTADDPAAAAAGVITAKNQEIDVAIPLAGSAVDTSPCPFVENFTADQEGSDIVTGTMGLAADNDKRAVRKIDGYTLQFVRREKISQSVISGADLPALTYAPGAAVGVVGETGQPPAISVPPAIPNYTLDSVTIDPRSEDRHDYIKVEADNRITGKMPPYNATVYYDYRKQASEIHFDANGADNPPPLTGNAGDPVKASFPYVSRPGYTSLGWSLANNQSDPSIETSLPAVFPTGSVTYYAIYKADEGQQFDYTVTHKNKDGSQEFVPPQTPQRTHYVGEPIPEHPLTIHGYRWSGSSFISPVQFNYAGTLRDVGAFDGHGEFTGQMPAQATTVNFRYEVDQDNLSARSPYTIRYRLKTADGTLGRELADPVSNDLYPEAAISAAPKEIQGYTCVGADFTKGTAAVTDPAASGGVRTAVQGTLNPSTHVLTGGVMPNQDVEVTYLYVPAAVTYGLTVEYLDKDTSDTKLQTILTDGPTLHPAEAHVDGSYTVPYGYQSVGAEAGDKTIVPAASLGGGLTWTGTGGNDFTGTMPNQAAAVTYRQHRDGTKWKTITYKTGSNGSLAAGDGVSPDVIEHTADGGSYFTTQVLVSDGSALGNTKAYRLSDLSSKGLVPKAKPGTSYIFKGWTDDSGALLADNAVFTADTNLTASFTEDPSAWCTVKLEVSHGSMNPDQISIRVPNGQTWASIKAQLPTIEGNGAHGKLTAESNYLEGSWYQGIVRMSDAMPLMNGQTYTYKFKPDPTIFGINAETPNAQAGINGQGESRITVYTAYGEDVTMADYQYVVTNEAGSVLAAQPGSALGWVQLDHLQPGTRYKVYEARTTDPIYVGHPLSASFNEHDLNDKTILNVPEEILTPVVETNYKVSYDVAEDGKVALTIQPADTDSDYAVLDETGTVVTEPGQAAGGGWKHPSGPPASVRFSGLSYNKKYIIVARPKGTDISAESKKDDGNTIVTDLGAEPELQNCIIETLGGTIDQVRNEAPGTSRYETAHEGDKVAISAPHQDGDGMPFQRWELLVGPDKGFKGLAGLNPQAETTSFTMPDTNVVLHAVYKKAAASPSNAEVKGEMRGAKKGRLALAPQSIPDLETALTTDADRTLMDKNHANVLYKVIYQKDSVKASESDAVKEDGIWDTAGDHAQAYKTIFSLDISAERYINGRRAGKASTSDASVRTYVQTGDDDTDMLDYRLYEIEEDEDGDGDGAATAIRVDLMNTDESEADPAKTGGLFVFDGQIGHRYVLVCSQAYRLKFINDTVADAPINYSFRVRKEEAPTSGGYDDEYNNVPPLEPEWNSPIGVYYHDPEWSYRSDQPKPFDEGKLITKKTYVYAYYQNDQKEVDQGRKALEEAIRHAISVGNDPFLHPDEQEEVFAFIRTAQAILDQREPMASNGALHDALSTLKQSLVIPEKKLAERYGDYNRIQNNKPQGGSGSSVGGGGGGGGGSSNKAPFGSGAAQNYQKPDNGDWEIVPGENGQPPQKRFNLNGGEPLKDMWAILDAPESAAGPGASGPGTSAPSAAGPGGQGWYHFDAQGNMQTGWLSDKNGNWYYLNTEAEGDDGRMQTGFKQVPGDPVTYYLDPATGAMATGWREIDGKWYYFNPVSGNVYSYDPIKEQWIHGAAGAKPLGAMYKNERTPDGYQVGPDGARL